MGREGLLPGEGENATAAANRRFSLADLAVNRHIRRKESPQHHQIVRQASTGNVVKPGKPRATDSLHRISFSVCTFGKCLPLALFDVLLDHTLRGYRFKFEQSFHLDTVITKMKLPPLTYCSQFWGLGRSYCFLSFHLRKFCSHKISKLRILKE